MGVYEVENNNVLCYSIEIYLRIFSFWVDDKTDIQLESNIERCINEVIYGDIITINGKVGSSCHDE